MPIFTVVVGAFSIPPQFTDVFGSQRGECMTVSASGALIAGRIVVEVAIVVLRCLAVHC